MNYKRWIIIAVLLFGAGLVIGLATPASIADLMSEEIEALGELSRILAPFSVVTAILIFIKNASALVLGFFLSPILCLVPILTLTVNGWVLAFVSSMAAQEESIGFVLAGLLPHGIFELPAFILGEAAALSFGTMAIVALFKEERRELLLPNLKQNLRYLVIALALLLLIYVLFTIIRDGLRKRKQ